MHSRYLCGGALVAWSLVSAPAIAAQSNVLIIVADDVGVDNVNVYQRGAAPPPTPNIDALAANGVLFRNAWANPWCSPTRACIHTGRYSFRTGVGRAVTYSPGTVESQGVLQLSELTVPELLDAHQSGYAHLAVGKWHLGDGSNGGPMGPNLAGWSQYAGLLKGQANYYRWPRTVNGTTSISRIYATTHMVDDALSLMESTPEPWVCYLSFLAAHAPVHVPPPSLHTRTLPATPPHLTPTPFFKAAVEAMDTEIGRLLTTMGPSLLTRTNVIFIGDNGTPGGVSEPPFLPSHAKGTPEGGVHVPLIVMGPAVASPGREEQALVSAVDLFSTVLELCGITPPAPFDPSRPEETSSSPNWPIIDSVSFLPLLTNASAAPVRNTLFAEAFAGNSVTTTGFATIRNKTFKLIYRPDAEPASYELYDLVTDPFETTDLLVRPLNAVEAANFFRLKTKLTQLRNS